MTFITFTLFSTPTRLSYSHTHMHVSLFLQAVMSEQVDAAAQRSSPDSDWAPSRGSDQRRSTSSVGGQQVGYHTLQPIRSKRARGWVANMPRRTHCYFAQNRSKPERRDTRETVCSESWFIRPCSRQPLSWTLPHTCMHTDAPPTVTRPACAAGFTLALGLGTG